MELVELLVIQIIFFITRNQLVLEEKVRLIDHFISMSLFGLLILYFGAK